MRAIALAALIITALCQTMQSVVHASTDEAYRTPPGGSYYWPWDRYPRHGAHRPHSRIVEPSGGDATSWLETLRLWLSALLVSVVAGAGALIAYGQWKIARDRLRYDEFYRQYERRFAVYEATRKILAQVFVGGLSENEIRVFVLSTLDAKFLFNDKMAKYLAQIGLQIHTWQDADSSADKSPDGDEKDEHKRIRAEALNWIRQQGDEATGFDTKFRPFLEVPQKIRRLWGLR